ncbi:sigma factor, partial [Mesorhizobium sp. M5C.F.Ca.IN.020.32.2.1]|uniref:sigma factor n=1 Tax=Mesorhizobium sp. M5C.F.Ca.IN.020.32.2.1 TaxID=2496771 RepID=UPI0024795B83
MTRAADRFALAACAAPRRRVQSDEQGTSEPAVMDEKKAAILGEIPRLRRYARSLLRDRDSADDLVQDCLERALVRLDNWQTGESPRKWLFT